VLKGDVDLARQAGSLALFAQEDFESGNDLWWKWGGAGAALAFVGVLALGVLSGGRTIPQSIQPAVIAAITGGMVGGFYGGIGSIAAGGRSASISRALSDSVRKASPSPGYLPSLNPVERPGTPRAPERPPAREPVRALREPPSVIEDPGEQIKKADKAG
jgi:hypothetical protein